MSERRLAAVMFVDVVGFTQLSQQNEERALALLEEYRQVLRPLFSQYNGKEVKTIGDGFLVEFGSALQAVRCAYSIQQALYDRNSSSHNVNPPISARIGVHVGDVVHEQNDIHGDAVNIASRIEPLAEPGGICISQPVEVQVANKFEFPIVSMGIKTLKNVLMPIEVFRVVLPWERSQDSASGAQPKTRVAVLPFSNISPEKSDEYFADGITEELINVISHNRQLKVIARTTIGRYKDTAKSIREIGREIGAGSILEGSVRKAGNKVRVTAQLIDAVSEDHLWSDNYDRQLDDVFSIQSEIAKSVSDALAAKLLPSERSSLGRRPTNSSSAYVKYLKGRALLRDRTEAGMTEAKRLFEAAISDDPNYAEAYAGLADAYFLLGDYNYMPFAEARGKASEVLQKALLLNDELAEAHNTLAELLAADYRFSDADSEFKRAISINPNYSLAHHWYGICLLEMGDLPRSNEETSLALELDPLSPTLSGNLAFGYAISGDLAKAKVQLSKLKEVDTLNTYFDFGMGLISEQEGDFNKAAEYMEDAVRQHPDHPFNIPILGMYLGRAGQLERANQVLEQIKARTRALEAKPFDLALVYGGLGRWDEMFEQFELAFENRTLLFRTLRYSSLKPLIKDNPRYDALFRRAGLQP